MNFVTAIAETPRRRPASAREIHSGPINRSYIVGRYHKPFFIRPEALRVCTGSTRASRHPAGKDPKREAEETPYLISEGISSDSAPTWPFKASLSQNQTLPSFVRAAVTNTTLVVHLPKLSSAAA